MRPFGRPGKAGRTACAGSRGPAHAPGGAQKSVWDRRRERAAPPQGVASAPHYRHKAAAEFVKLPYSGATRSRLRTDSDGDTWMRRYLATLLIMVLPALGLGAHKLAAQEPSATGLWQQIDQDTGKSQGWFLIFEHNGVYEGAIAKMFMEPGEPPNPMCDKCKGDQKNTPWLGLTIIKGMQRKGLDYESGTILNPIDGNEWSALMKLSPDGQDLTVRGFLGFAMLGKNQYWKRLADASCKEIDPAVGARLSFAAMGPGCTLPKPRAQAPAPARATAPAR
jgi:Uncharacterized protein conserved in bacteria (DUF2147)